MKYDDIFLKKEEQVMFFLRSLFERYGYRKFKMSKFEKYDFYADNRSFLKSESILAFTGPDGKLLALKPDITLSIVKNTKADRTRADRVYYTETVYRVRPGTDEYKEILQAGIEYIGDVDEYSTLEVLMLAEKSLAASGEEYLMSVSHMGFITGILEETKLTCPEQKKVIEAISCRNIHGIRKMCTENGVPEDMIVKLEKIAGLYGTLECMLPKIKELCLNDKMTTSYNELESLLGCLKEEGKQDKFYLDFSIVNDMDYYNGIIFQGFINGISGAILSGGRYDKLLKKFGKDADAIGFALSLDLLERIDSREKEYDVDTLLVYDKGTDTAALMKAAEMLRSNGQSVMVVNSRNDDIKYKQLLYMRERGIEIVTGDN